MAASTGNNSKEIALSAPVFGFVMALIAFLGITWFFLIVSCVRRCFSNKLTYDLEDARRDRADTHWHLHRTEVLEAEFRHRDAQAVSDYVARYGGFIYQYEPPSPQQHHSGTDQDIPLVPVSTRHSSRPKPLNPEQEQSSDVYSATPIQNSLRANPFDASDSLSDLSTAQTASIPVRQTRATRQVPLSVARERERELFVKYGYGPRHG